jgi:16S rRNA C1402 N4-methylase RsmH
LAEPYIAERLLKILNPKANGLYLDNGCGTANYTNIFRKKSFILIGVKSK